MVEGGVRLPVHAQGAHMYPHRTMESSKDGSVQPWVLKHDDNPMLWVLEQYQNQKLKDVDGIGTTKVEMTYGRNKQGKYRAVAVEFTPIMFGQEDSEALNSLCTRASCTWRLSNKSSSPIHDQMVIRITSL